MMLTILIEYNIHLFNYSYLNAPNLIIIIFVMNSLLLFILPYLLIFSIVTSNEISIGETKHEQLTETSQYYTLSLTKSEISSKYLIFETAPTIYSNRASIFISQTEEHPSESSYTYSSSFFGKNKQIVPLSELTDGIVYIGVHCIENCDYTIQIEESNEISLSPEESQKIKLNKEEQVELMFHPEEGTTHSKLMFTIYDISNKEKSVK